MEKKLLVISIDTFITEDLEIMKTLPNFSRVLEESSVVERNLTTYPPGKARRCDQREISALCGGAAVV